MTQTQRVFDYMLTHGSISAKEAMDDLGVMRLASRIHDLSSSGIPIKKWTEKSENRFGEEVRYTRYSL